jgi:hypothetical protein
MGITRTEKREFDGTHVTKTERTVDSSGNSREIERVYDNDFILGNPTSTKITTGKVDKK